MNNFALFISAFSLTALLTFVLRKQAAKVGLVDRPCQRKQHCGEVPVIGGIAIFAAFFITVLLAHMVVVQQSIVDSAAFLVAAAILVAVGVLDDKYNLPSQPRFLTQIFAATMMCLWGGVVLRDLGMLSLDNNLFTLGSLAVPFTIFATVGAINAINMSDGIDGLSGSLSMVALSGLAIVSYVGGNYLAFSVIVTLMAAVSAFLLFNLRFPGRPSALVFLGDGGSMFLGFALTWYLIAFSQGADRIMTPVTALWLLAMPLFDTVGIMLRRIIKGRSPFQADREHFHHAFQLAGFSVFQTSLIITGCALLCMLIGLAGLYFKTPEWIMFTGFMALFGLYFWGMMRAWKVMRFLRRNMRQDSAVAAQAELDNQRVVAIRGFYSENAESLSQLNQANLSGNKAGHDHQTNPSHSEEAQQNSSVHLEVVMSKSTDKDAGKATKSAG